MLRAIIFDFDGVIVDSESMHLRAFQKVLGEEGVVLTDEAYYGRYLGLDDKHCFSAVWTDAGRSADAALIRNLVDRKAAWYAAHQDAVPILPGAPAFIRTAAARYPLAIGSGALRREIEYTLRRAALSALIPVIVSAEDIERSKPAPDCYLRVLERLNSAHTDGVPPFAPSECAVIEDARHGIAAARAAGMRCVAVATSYPREALQEADLIVPGLETLRVEQVEQVCR